MQARTLKIIAALLIISAVIMGIIGYRISQQDAIADQRRQAAATQATSYTYAQKLVIANRNIAKDEILAEDALMLVPYPIKVDGSYASVEELLNKRSKQAILQGAVIRASDFETGSTLADHIKPGHRAVAVKVDEVIGSGGFLKPGDYVDVIFNSRAAKETQNKRLSRRVLSNIRIIAFGDVVEGETDLTGDDDKAGNKRNGSKDGGKRSRSAVLEIPVDAVNRLVLAENAGSLRLAAIGEAERLERAEQLAQGETPQRSDDKATLMREVTGFKPAPSPRSIYMYSGDKVETIRVRD